MTPTPIVQFVIPSTPELKIVKIFPTKRLSPGLKSFYERDQETFLKAFPHIVDQIVSHRDHADMVETNKWLENVLIANVPTGKMIRGLLTVHAFRNFVFSDQNRPPTPKEEQMAVICGWCVEILHAAHLIKTNIMEDIRETRNRPSWHIESKMGPAAFNDAVLLTGALFHVIMDNFEDKKWCQPLMDLFHEAQIYRAFGESLFKRTHIAEQMKYLNISRYEMIVKYQTGYFSFYFPVATAMLAAGIEPKNTETFEKVKEVLLRIGFLYQVTQDIAKFDSDLVQGKLTWFIFTAIQRASSAEKKILAGYYGSTDFESIQKVRRIFENMNLMAIAQEFVQSENEEIEEMMKGLPSQIPNPLMIKILDFINICQSD